MRSSLRLTELKPEQEGRSNHAVLILIIFVLILAVTAGGTFYWQQQQQAAAQAAADDDLAAAKRRTIIEVGEIQCQTKLIGLMRDYESKEYCHQQFQPEWDNWTHEFPKAARERALARQQ
jgi:uncharacterized protein HemX